MHTQYTIFSRIDYAAFALLVLMVFIFPQYSLNHSPIETVFALEPTRAEKNNSIDLGTVHDTIQNPIIIAQNALMAFNAPPDNGYRTAWTIWVPATAYSSTPDQTDGDPFVTASGERVRDGVVAANFLPLHTKVRLPSLYGEKVFEVKDRMNSRYFYRVDIWMPMRWQALQFGLRNVPVEVLY